MIPDLSVSLRTAMPAEWFFRATNELLAARTMLAATECGRLQSHKRGPGRGRRYYFIDDVVRAYPQFKALILAASADPAQIAKDIRERRADKRAQAKRSVTERAQASNRAVRLTA